MQATRALRAAQAYQPLIKFIGKHHPPANVSHTPAPHPASPSHALPDSFANYRAKAQSHGPLGNGNGSSSGSGAASRGVVQDAFAGQSQVAHGVIGGHSGREMGSVQPQQGLAFDRSQLPRRFHRLAWSEGEMDAVEMGGADRVLQQGRR